jgi:hypothetical protein
MTTNLEAPHVYRAISAVTGIMAREGISKSRSNAAQGYKFRGIDEVYNAVSTHLAANHLCVLPRVVDRSVVERASAKGGVLIYTTLTVEFDLVSSVDGSKHTIVTVGEAMDSGDKSSNKAMSAATKYAILVAFQIPTEGDNDADAHSPEPTRRLVGPAVAPLDGPALAPVLDGYVASIDKSPDVPTLTRVHAQAQADGRLLDATKKYIRGLCSEKRRQLEGRAA